MQAAALAPDRDQVNGGPPVSTAMARRGKRRSVQVTAQF